MNRKALLLATLSALAIGLLATCTPFIAALQPSAKADAGLVRIDVSALPPGSFRIELGPEPKSAPMGYRWGIFFLRQRDGRLRAWDVPVKNGAVGLPDLKWWRPTFECKAFGPTVVGGVLDEQSPIQCHDPDIPAWWAAEWQWNIQGKRQGKMVEDMMPTRGAVVGKEFVVGKPPERP